MKRMAFLFAAITMVGCDPVVQPTPQTSGQTTSHPVLPRFSIDPILWGATKADVSYEIRDLADGTPGLYDANGAVVLRLLPELVIDLGPAGKGRIKPSRLSFEVVKLTAGANGGFTLFARAEDKNAQFDLRIENGMHDPRVHVGLSTKWRRDVDLQRQVLVFRSGAIGSGQALRHDLEWVDPSPEWVSGVHVPNIARFGDGALTAIGRVGTENLVLREADQGWEIEFEGYHYENHPLEFGNKCDERIDGTARVAAGEKWEMRVDFNVGQADLPIVMPYPNARKAAIALVDEPQARAVALSDSAQPLLVPTPTTWAGPSVEALPCEAGRFDALKASGVRAMWAGIVLQADGETANLLAPTEGDSRRVVAFEHPNASVPSLFALDARAPSPDWLGGPALATLKSSRGLIMARVDLTSFLGRDASSTKTVREVLVDLGHGDAVWNAEVGAVADRLNALAGVDFEYLPGGVIRVRNHNEAELAGLTLRLPDGVTAKLPTGTIHQAAGQFVSFNLPAQGDQLLQLFKGEEPYWTIRPAAIRVAETEAKSP